MFTKYFKPQSLKKIAKKKAVAAELDDDKIYFSEILHIIIKAGKDAQREDGMGGGETNCTE